MNPVLVATLALSLTLELAAADLQNIQNANPLNIDLSDPSQTQSVTGDDSKFGGYRPLYPPYFLRESTNVGQEPSVNDQTYFDKEYYTRGTSHDDRLDRSLRIATPGIVRSTGFVRAFAKSDRFASSSSSHVAARSYFFSGIR